MLKLVYSSNPVRQIATVKGSMLITFITLYQLYIKYVQNFNLNNIFLTWVYVWVYASKCPIFSKIFLRVILCREKNSDFLIQWLTLPYQQIVLWASF